MSYIIKMALDIKAGFGPPAPMSSPIEGYCAIGTVSKNMGLPMPEKKDTLFEMREQLTADLAGREPEEGRIRKILQILLNFIRNADTTDQMMEYVAYGYEQESFQGGKKG